MSTAPTTSDLSVSEVWKSFAGVPALRGASLELRRGTVHCLIGSNGSGKSTLIKILAGVQRADAGTLTAGGDTIPARAADPRWARSRGLSFVHQDLAMFPAFSVAENLAAVEGFPTTRVGSIRWRTVREDSAKLLARFHMPVDPGLPVGALGPAQRAMLAIARALGHETEGGGGMVVLDEPTAALPPGEAAILLAALRRYAADGHAVLLTTHRLDEVLAVADHVTVLRDGVVVESRPAEGLTKAGLTRDLIGASLPSADTAVRVPPAAATGARDVLLSVAGLTAGGVRGADLELRAGEIVGLAGLLGSGRSSLLGAIFGIGPRTGTVRVGGTVVAPGDVAAAMAAGIAYVPEDRDAYAIFGALDVGENLAAVDVGTFWRGLRLRRREEHDRADESMRRYRIRARSRRQSIVTLSGGNRQKVAMARWLRSDPQVLLLDEPSQGVDVGAREEIHRAIREATAAGAAVLVVSSDLDELEGLSDRVLLMDGGKIAAELAPDRLRSMMIGGAA